MGDAGKQATSVLLPSSGVAVYSNDKKTRKAIEALSEDWRFARVDMQGHDGGIENAIKHYETNDSPDLVIVQTDNVDDGFTALLDSLAEQCNEGTAAIVVGPENDVYLYRRMIEMGVSDYLVAPMTVETLSDVIVKTLIERMGIVGSRLVAMVGAKGGVGTSVLTQAMAWCSADSLSQKTVVLDCAGGWSSLAVGIGFEPAATLLEAVRAAENGDEDSLKRMLFAASDKLSVLATGSDTMLSSVVEPEQLEILLDMLMVKYPVVLADLSGAEAALKKMVLARANQVILVTTPTLPSLRLSRSIMQEIKDIRGGDEDNVNLLVNMQGMEKSQQLSSKDVEAAMDVKPVGEVPYSPKVFMGCESEGKKITDDKAGSALSNEVILPLVQKILSLEPADADVKSLGNGAGILGGLFKKSKT